MNFDHTNVPAGIELSKESVLSIRESAIDRTCRLDVPSFSHREGYADSPDDLKAIEPSELYGLCEQQLDGFGDLDDRDQDTLFDYLLYCINRSL